MNTRIRVGGGPCQANRPHDYPHAFDEISPAKRRPTVHSPSPHFSGVFFLGSGPIGAIFKWETRVESTLRPRSSILTLRASESLSKQGRTQGRGPAFVMKKAACQISHILPKNRPALRRSLKTPAPCVPLPIPELQRPAHPDSGSRVFELEDVE